MIQFVTVCVILSAMSPDAARAQDVAARAATIRMDERLPDDPRVTVGTLANGLRYYIHANVQPENRADLRLVVNVGSIVEDEDQQGLAHFLEHMAFNGTTHFQKQELLDYMESIGMRLGGRRGHRPPEEPGLLPGQVRRRQ